MTEWQWNIKYSIIQNQSCLISSNTRIHQVSKSTLDDISFMGKHTFGDFTKTAKEAAKKGGLFSKVSLKVTSERWTSMFQNIQNIHRSFFCDGSGEDLFSFLLYRLLFPPFRAIMLWKHFGGSENISICILCMSFFPCSFPLSTSLKVLRDL